MPGKEKHHSEKPDKTYYYKDNEPCRRLRRRVRLKRRFLQHVRRRRAAYIYKELLKLIYILFYLFDTPKIIPVKPYMPFAAYRIVVLVPYDPLQTFINIGVVTAMLSPWAAWLSC